MARNFSGLADTDDYSLGRGIWYIAALNTDGSIAETGWRDMGNSPDSKLTASSNTLKHISSRSGLAFTDKEVVLSTELALSFTLDEINDQNLALGLSGVEANFTNSAIAGFTDAPLVAAANPSNITPGRWYDIKNASGVRAYSILAAKTTVKTTAGSPVTLVLGTDYNLDLVNGRVFIIANASTGAGSTAVATAIAANQGLTVTLTAHTINVDTFAVNEIQALTKTSVSVALKFVQTNAANNDNREFNFWKVNLKVDGDFDLIGQDWSKVPFSGVTGTNAVAGGTASPTLTIRNLK